MVATQSRRHWRGLILEELQQTWPIQSRWLQEHPQRVAILNELVSETMDLWWQTLEARRDPSHRGPTSMTDTELQTHVVVRVLEIPELWPDLAEQYPRQTPTPKPAPFGPLELFRPTGPTGPPSPRDH